MSPQPQHRADTLAATVEAWVRSRANPLDGPQERQEKSKAGRAALSELVLAHAGAETNDQIRITQNVYELLVEAKRERNAAGAETERLREALREIASTDFDEPSDFSELGRIARAALAGGQADKPPTVLPDPDLDFPGTGEPLRGGRRGGQADKQAVPAEPCDECTHDYCACAARAGGQADTKPVTYDELRGYVHGGVMRSKSAAPGQGGQADKEPTT